MENKITRESMDMIVDEIVDVMNRDWMDEDSKRMEIERILVAEGLAVVMED